MATEAGEPPNLGFALLLFVQVEIKVLIKQEIVNKQEEDVKRSEKTSGGELWDQACLGCLLTQFSR